MSKDSHFMQAIRSLLDESKFGVLATYMEDQPYANLVTIMPYRDAHSLIFVTPRTTRKYVNLKKHPKAALLINTCANSQADFAEAKGVNACGEAHELFDSPERDSVVKAFIKKHPAVKDFVQAPTTAIFELRVTTYYFVENFQEVTEIHLQP